MSGSDIYLCDNCREHGIASQWPEYTGEPKERNCILCGARPAPHAFVATRLQVKEVINSLRPKPPVQ